MKKIKFTYIGDYAYNVIDRPLPSKEFIPKWFKDMKPYVNDNTLMVNNGSSNASAKKCTPMLDAMIYGYTVPLWSDVQVQNIDGIPRITWRVSEPVFDLHGPSSKDVPSPPGYSQVVFKYITHFRVSTPPGYSIMIRPIAGIYDPVFMPIPGLIDSDMSVIDTNIPLWVRSDFEGIVERGTPIAQIIPFKRDDWSSEFDFITKDKMVQQMDKGFYSTIANNYVKHIWSKKTIK